MSTRLGDLEVLDVDGRPHRLGEAWAERPCALVFVRHFGCLLCREQVEKAKPRVREIRDAGGDLVVVGTGGPSFSRAFQEDMKISDVRVYSDPDRRAYDLAGFRRGLLTLFHPRAVLNYVRAFLAGYRYTGIQGDPLQQGGVLVVRPDGEIVFRFAGKASGDAPDFEEVVSSVRAAAKPESSKP
jgi:peroxiredoxin